VAEWEDSGHGTFPLNPIKNSERNQNTQVIPKEKKTNAPHQVHEWLENACSHAILCVLSLL
jgi:hypothetical protein